MTEVVIICICHFRKISEKNAANMYLNYNYVILGNVNLDVISMLECDQLYFVMFIYYFSMALSQQDLLKCCIMILDGFDDEVYAIENRVEGFFNGRQVAY